MDRIDNQKRPDETPTPHPSPRIADPAGTTGPAGVWVFAYGSLMWKPGFAYQASSLACLRGYHRSLCIYSWVHRGTRERPGLVFGLDRGGACKGFAFRVAPDQEAEILAYLDERELVTDVYRRKRLSIDTDQGKVPAWCYVVRRDHPQYAGRLSEADLFEMIKGSEGRSGQCRDYILSTVRHLDEMGVLDITLRNVAKRLEIEP